MKRRKNLNGEISLALGLEGLQRGFKGHSSMSRVCHTFGLWVLGREILSPLPDREQALFDAMKRDYERGKELEVADHG